MIHYIEIKGFRGIRAGRIDGFRKFNVFVGPNNSGKSAVIEAIYLANTASREVGLIVERESGVETFPAFISEADFLTDDPVKRILARHSYSSPSETAARWEQGGVKVRVRDRAAPLSRFEIDAGSDRSLSDEAPSPSLFAVEGSPEADAERHRLMGQLMGEAGGLPAGQSRVVFCWQPDLSFFSRGSAAWRIDGRPSDAGHTLLFDTAVVQRQLSPALYQRMLGIIPGWTQRIAERFGAVFDIDPGTFTVQFVPVREPAPSIQGWIATRDRPALPIDTFGDGARAAFKLLTPLVALAESATEDAPGLLLWEEPESFQNPATLSRFLNEVFDMVRDKPIQIFFATHSLEIVANLTRMLAEGTISPADALLFQLNLKDGELISSWFDKDNLTAWLESGMDPRVWGDFIPPVQFRLEEDH